ncbi:putative lpxtg-domain-containing protein [Rosellinia necatrix]|uniref:Putative lpxtg-domain-containing protein n=1 Tax=Rosellinia necatrix TaxID=77044 RepID=A0A1W2TX04_ROSNE|nr:putative lpxtg-domain-containing protein [Rosellinia necatrix]
MRFGQVIIALGALARKARAVLVAHHSPCETNCGNVLDATAADQVVCDDADYGTTPGKVFQSCVTCESTSPYEITDGNQTTSDLQAMLFNMRFTTAQCVFRLETSPCSTIHACGRLEDALLYGNLSSSVSPYGYCSLWSDYELDKCGDCLVADGKAYARNFVSILSGACQLLLQPPQTIPLTGNIFASKLVTVTNPTNMATTQEHNRVGPLSSGALAGIVVGGVAFILVILGCGVVINGKRRRKSYLRRREEQTKNWPGPAAGGEMFETPLSQKPLRGGWGDSPVSAATTDGAYPYPRYFSPYATQFDSPISAVEGPSQMAWPVEKAQSIGVALSPDHDKASSPWGDRKGKERADASVDGYELQEGINSAGGYSSSAPPPPPTSSEAPVLNHPGYGR